MCDVTVLNRPIYANLLVVALLAGGMALAIGPSREASEAKRLAERGETTFATVERSSATRTGENRSIEEDVTFESVHGDTVHVRLKDCDSRTLDPPGSKVEVRYDPDHPTEHSATRFLHPACTGQFVKTSIGFTIAAATLLLLAHLFWGFRWARARWKWWGGALTLALLGGITTAAAFSKACDCLEMAWVAAPMTLLGLVALVGHAHRRSLSAATRR
jgi:hypothetical protein